MTRDGRRLSLEYSHASGVAARIALKESLLGTIGQLPLLSSHQPPRKPYETYNSSTRVSTCSQLDTRIRTRGGGGSGGAAGGASAGSSAGTSVGTTAGSS